MHTAECGQEVVPHNFVRKVIDLYRCRVSLVPFRLAQEIISSYGRVKNIARLHAIAIVVLIVQARKRPVSRMVRKTQIRSMGSFCHVRNVGVKLLLSFELTN
jgi:hypothetical protein